MKLNCWEYKKCGRQPGGAKEQERGACPAATDLTHEGENGGRAGGRYCWRVAGTLCGGKVQGTFAVKIMNCLDCDFFLRVSEEEGEAFVV